MSLGISVEWVPPYTGLEDVRATSALMRIVVGERTATRVSDELAKSIRSEIRVSASPLALWFASSWWRLRWEPASTQSPDLSWKMAHEMPAAANGFLWPRLVFDCDSDTTTVTCHRSPGSSAEPIHYLEDFSEMISAAEFEAGIDDFMNLVLDRLDAVQLRETSVHTIWREVCEERHDPASAWYRRLEASLGFDPDEAPSRLVEKLMALASDCGTAAISEITPVCAGDDVERKYEQIVELARSLGVEGRIEPFDGLAELMQSPSFAAGPPWQRGYQLARAARNGYNLSKVKIDNSELADLLGANYRIFEGRTDDRINQLIGLAVKTDEARGLSIHLRSKNPTSRRFEAARLLCDTIIAPEEDKWLPVTDIKTGRQKLQRAFAAEFLCPIVELKSYLANDYSNGAIEDAGDYFGISPLAITNHLNNYNLR